MSYNFMDTTGGREFADSVNCLSREIPELSKHLDVLVGCVKDLVSEVRDLRKEQSVLKERFEEERDEGLSERLTEVVNEVRQREEEGYKEFPKMEDIDAELDREL